MIRSRFGVTAPIVTALLVSTAATWGLGAAVTAQSPEASAPAASEAAATTEPTPPPPITPLPTVDATHPPVFTAEQWDDLVKAAQAEGELVVVTGPEGVQDDGDWLNQFTAEYGIPVTVTGGATADTTARTFAERAQGIYSIDISDQGGTGTQNFLDAGILDNLDQLLVNPEVTDRSTGFAIDHPVYTAEDAVGICQYIAVQAEPNLISFWYNTDQVSPEDYAAVKSFNDLLDPKFAGKIVLGDVQAGEADRDAVTMWEALGQSWWDKLFTTMQPSIVPYGDERSYADGLSQGKWAIGMFPPGSGSLQDAEDAGLPVAVWQNTLAEGSPRSGIQRVCPVKNAPHPAAAQLFANWSLMKDGQTALNAYTNRDDRASLRDDVPQGKITDDIWNRARDPKNIFVDDVNPAWLQAKADFHTYITNLYNQLHVEPGS